MGQLHGGALLVLKNDFSAANLVNCCELMVIINQTIMHCNIVHSQYVF